MLRSTSRLLPLILFCLLPAAVMAATGDHMWSVGYASGGRSDVDGGGNIISAGTFIGTQSWGGPSITAGADSDVFMARHDTNGNHLWTQQFTPSLGFVSIDYLACDEAGNFYIMGKLWMGFNPPGPGTIDFGGGVLSGDNEGFLAGFDSNGNHLFSFQTGSTNARAIVASNGRVAVTGYTYGTIDFGGGSLTSAGGADLFLGVVSSAGAHVSSQLIGGVGDQGGMDLAYDSSGNLILSATSLEPIDFGGGVLTPTDITGLCLVKYDSNNNHVWSQMFHGDFNSGGGILADAWLATSSNDDHIVMSGHLQTSVDFGGGTLWSNGNGDVFVAKFDTNGAHSWSNNWGGSKTDSPRGLAMDHEDNIFVTGVFFSSSVSFGGGSFTPNTGASDYFTVLYDTAGSHLWSNQFGLTPSTVLISAHTDPLGRLMASGYCSGTVDFGGGVLASSNLFHVKFEGEASAPTSVTPLRMGADLKQNNPNPFNPQTSIRFVLDADGPARLAVYDSMGRHVVTLAEGNLAAGDHQFLWTGRNARGAEVASGVYFYRLTAGGSTQTRKMLLAK